MIQQLSTTSLGETDHADIAEAQPAEALQTLSADELKLIAGGPTIDNDPK